MKLENIHILESDLKKGVKHFYINKKPLKVVSWYDLYISEGNATTDHFIYDNEVVYFNIEGKTENGVYFNIKSSDAIAKKIIIK